MKKNITKPIFYLILALYAFISLFPFVWTIVSSLKSSDEILGNALSLPSKLHFENYKQAWTTHDIARIFFNTFGVSLVTVVCVMVFSCMAAYVLARVWKSTSMYIYFIAGIMVPIYVMLLPISQFLRSVGLFDNLVGLTLVYIGVNLPMNVFILHGFMQGIPFELEDAAYIDGCSRTKTFFRIIFPMTKPALATTGILTLIGSWNEFLIPLILINSKENMVLTIAIRSFQGEFRTDYGTLMATIVISLIPVVILYVLFQQQVIKGMTAGAVKG